jgi:leucyl/phenylalanyl-tRNA--protein transferase
MHPREPAPSGYRFAEAMAAATPGEDLVAVGADLAPGTVLAAYRAGLFPMGLGERGGAPIGWWSPDPRGVLPLVGMHVSRSLRAACRRFEVTLDQDFDGVVRGCADPSRPGAWISEEIAQAYRRLFDLGWAHSVECRRDGRLVGGVYGLSIGGFFAGESMFHTERDASKVALVALARRLNPDDDARRLFDVQWRTPHLASLGVVEISRKAYLNRLFAAVSLPSPPWE